MSVKNDLAIEIGALLDKNIDHNPDYFGAIKQVIAAGDISAEVQQRYQDDLYKKVYQEILYNSGKPSGKVSFGTSGWRGILGKDLFCKSVVQVVSAIVEMYRGLSENETLTQSLGVKSIEEAKERGCVIGFDNRFCGETLARVAVELLDREGFTIFYAGESTTGALSAVVLQLDAAFSINFTPSHNPLEYGGLKFNAADAGPAASEITQYITLKANQIIEQELLPSYFRLEDLPYGEMSERVKKIDAFSLWQKHVIENEAKHGLNYKEIIKSFSEKDDFSIAIDSVHGASRLHIGRFFNSIKSDRLDHVRNEADVTFGGVAPEPSSENLRVVKERLVNHEEKFKLGAIIDPDGDRIRFTDGSIEISMNQFGAMAYHFLHEHKNRKGLVAKTVATSNLANSVAEKLGEEVFEPPVGFKEFKPVIGKALVCFEESDGISIIGHTPEKDAYIGLLLAIDMVITTGKNLGEYLHDIEEKYGYFYPDRDGVEVSLKGEELIQRLSQLNKYAVGESITVGTDRIKITKVIDIDGRKMIFEDGSWLMIRPSGTEPKVRFYVESRTANGSVLLVESAKMLIAEIGVV